MSETVFTPLHLVPEGRGMLACRCEVPDGWVQPPLPEEEYDFSNASVFLPLLLSMAPYGAVVFTIAARPAFEDGSVQDWAEFLASQNSLVIERLRQARIDRMPCVLCDATMDSEMGPMRSRSVFLEDGGRLYNIGTLAPESIWPSVEATFNRLLASFRLDDVQGLTHPPLREMTSESAIDLAELTNASNASNASNATNATNATANANANADPAAGAGRANGDGTAPDGSAVPAAASIDDAPAESAANDRPTQAIEVALTDNTDSLDPEHPLNARFRDNGVGLVPRIIMVATREKFVTVGAGAIEAMFRVPFGWHVVDDGKRTLVFDAGGKMQINMDLRPATASEHTALLTRIGSDLAAEQPEALFLKMELMGMPVLAVRNLVINGEELEQAYFARGSNRPDLALVCRVSSDPEHMTFAMNTAEVILGSLQGPAPVEEEFAGHPAWWREAVLLERQDRLDEAEAVIQRALDHIGVYSQVAYLHELRYARLAQAGNAAGAQEAKERAIQWLYTYAGSATSGGEGAALSYERDQRIAALGGETTRA